MVICFEMKTILLFSGVRSAQMSRNRSRTTRHLNNVKQATFRHTKT